ncbi:annulin-like [Leptopilina heterotoma]|uniref:annulin-like n=1 Tax=Leptopilina heterotoma TaxID=63436 RepID=UPI001CA81271|nr:annulin-like [Leptopilina heterotoma]
MSLSRFKPRYPDYRSTLLSVKTLNRLIVANGRAHRTSKYEIMSSVGKEAQLVLRRGQEFYINLTLSRNYDPINDRISLVFKLDGASNATIGQRTLVVIPVLGKNGTLSNTTWKATVSKTYRNIIQIKIITSADAIVGKWKMYIVTRNKKLAGAKSFGVKGHLYLLFNPWCTEDVVYLPLEKERYEYVLMDTGLIWRGSYGNMSPFAWKYAQFDENILECALYLMQNVGGVKPSSRNDPVIVTRSLSAAINANDDNGVLTGNWSKNFVGGTNPMKWLGSRKILQEYFKTKRSVKYGQCWVFAGVLATICRTLGIPCRAVTNFSSAHDNDNSVTLDVFFDEHGKVVKHLSEDPLWNYHVWNEVWMKRLDLGTQYSGWQAIDATPQALSPNIFRCGPTSIYAVKNGEILKSYDTAFLFAEVNADVVFWRYNGPSQPLKLVGRNINSVGKFISTKAVGKWEREDITDNYKHPETTAEERDIMVKALRQSKSLYSHYYLNGIFHNVKFNLDLHGDIVIGQPFRVRMKVENISSEEDFRVKLILRVAVVSYRGIVTKYVKRLKMNDILMKQNQKKKIDLPVTWKEYFPYLQHDTNFQISCLASVHGTNYEYYAKDNVAVKKPGIIVKILSDPKVGYELQASAEFSNPLPISLKKGKFIIDGPGLAEQLKLVLSEPVRPGQLAKCFFSMMPNHSGKATIVVKFYSKELSDINGFKEFMVKFVNSYFRSNHTGKSIESDCIESDSIESDSIESDCIEGDSIESNSKESNSKQSNSKQSNSKQSNSKQCNSKQSNSKQSNSKQCNSKQSNSKQSNSKQSNSKQSNSIESDCMESDSIESDFIESNCIERDSIESDCMESDSIESDSIESNCMESDSIESDSQTRLPSMKIVDI